MYDQGDQRSFGSINTNAFANGLHSVRNISHSFKMCPTRTFFSTFFNKKGFKKFKNLKFSNLTLNADEVLVLLCPACQTLEKSILRKISLITQKNCKNTDEYDTTDTKGTWFHDNLDILELQMHRIALIWTWYGLYDIGFIKRASVISYLGSGSYQF